MTAEKAPDKTVVVHMIGNAHLDLVWLWRWPAGLWEALATCRTACDLLDEYPEFHYTRGEAWVHRAVEQHDPTLFARIRKYVEEGRWHLVNGWWVQPDANFPAAATFRRHAELGQGYFERAFGRRADVGYNVDSFGHCAMLPAFLHASGIDCYTFMRPGPHEKKLPGELFVWEAPTGERVTAARIQGAYCARNVEDLRANVDAAVATADPRVRHAMAWYGVGDHGGGPTREQLDWILEHRAYADGVELRLSHPRAFFDAVAAAGAELPIVREELQYHAVGCYSVVHEVKQHLRRAETLLDQAGHCVARFPEAAGEGAAAAVERAWERVLFNSFHDILAGTSIASAYEDARDELGAAKAAARDIVVSTTTRLTSALPGAARQRLVLTNLSPDDFAGYLDFEPSTPPDADPGVCRLHDEAGEPVPHQAIHAAHASGGITITGERLLFRAEVPAGGTKVLEIDRSEAEPRGRPHTWMTAQTWRSAELSVRADGTGLANLRHNEKDYLGAGGLRLSVREDLTDTWSHGVDRFDGRELGVFEAEGAWTEWEAGPLRTVFLNTFRWGSSLATMSAMLFKGEALLRLRLRVDWRERERVLKLALAPPPGGWGFRRDGSPGRIIPRPLDGRECPFYNQTLLWSSEGHAFAVVSRDVFGLDVQKDGTVGLTLLRSPAFAQHDPWGLAPGHPYPMTDQGTHDYAITLMPQPEVNENAAEMEVRRLAEPVWITDTTAGMGPRRT